MDRLNAVLRLVCGAFFSAFANCPVLLTLLVTSTIAAVAGALVFELLSPADAVRKAKSCLWANLFAIRLFADEPSIVLKSLLGVVGANARLVVSGLPSLTVLTPLFLIFYGHLDAFFGTRTLRVGVARVLTIRLNYLANGAWPDVQLQTPDWVKVQSPPVHVFKTKEVSWSIEPTRPARGDLRIIAGQEIILKTIDSRPGPRCFSLAREQSFKGALLYPAEPRLLPGVISEVNLFEPSTQVSLFGIALDWTWWFVIFWVLLVFPAKRTSDLFLRHLRLQ